MADKSRPFTREIRAMMWGFGDQVPEPGDCLPETVAAVEDCAMMFIRSVADAAVRTAGARDKVSAEDVMCVLQGDNKKRERVSELLRMHKRIKQERRKFEDVEELQEEDDDQEDVL
eukprot:TRINITY_DN9042_c0_g1_i1.p1 TRINITY_DN9042_c0_g1~~TRINITY_DN9042_c0_g1_i1.p1  ORF type:complete len:116 (+),score=42.71 TRINITY_DN9042_c0_g1_i1:229-576(+)